MSEIRDVQMMGYEILKQCVSLCEKHHLVYYLSCGTLLGAVRHEGFIPWDNDVDIEMPYEDYKKFLKYAVDELPKNLFLQTYYTDPGYNETWAKVRANGTTSLPVTWRKLNVHWGIGIDIFPLSGVCNNMLTRKIQRKCLWLCRTLIAKDFIIATNPDEITFNRKLQLIYKLNRKLRIKLCYVILNSLVYKKTNKKKYLSIVDGNIGCCLDKHAYEKIIKTRYENELFNIPSGYDYILEQLYGDYMTPPPLDKRGYGHELTLGKIIYDCQNDYSTYL